MKFWNKFLLKSGTLFYKNTRLKFAQNFIKNNEYCRPPQVIKIRTKAEILNLRTKTYCNKVLYYVETKAKLIT